MKSRKINGSNPYELGPRFLRTMCDCAEYEFEEMALEIEEKEPRPITVPLQLVRTKKK
jgi:hypothetical protein